MLRQGEPCLKEAHLSFKCLTRNIISLRYRFWFFGHLVWKLVWDVQVNYIRKVLVEILTLFVRQVLRSCHELLYHLTRRRRQHVEKDLFFIWESCWFHITQVCTAGSFFQCKDWLWRLYRMWEGLTVLSMLSPIKTYPHGDFEEHTDCEGAGQQSDAGWTAICEGVKGDWLAICEGVNGDWSSV